MIRLLILVVCLSVGFSGAIAAPRNVFGGTTSCGEWVRFKSFEDNRNNTRERANSYQLQSWMQGFLSGYNIASDGPDIQAARPSPVALAAWIDNYCKAKPLDTLGVAAVALTKELLSRAETR